MGLPIEHKTVTAIDIDTAQTAAGGAIHRRLEQLIHPNRPVIAANWRYGDVAGRIWSTPSQPRTPMKKLLLSVVLLTSLITPLHAQEQKPLYQEIAAMDKTLFDAFNRQDFETVKTVFSQDLEFFHDTGGLSNYEQNLQAMRNLFAQNMSLHRELVPDSMQVYPVKNYGAIQTGEHTFCHVENGKSDCGTFKFLHIWKRSAEGWKLARVASYGH